MRKVQEFLFDTTPGGPCPFNYFGAAVVRHHGPNIEDIEYICFSRNNRTLIPFAHGEINTIINCSQIIFNSPQYGPSFVNNNAFWQSTTMYTTGEPCAQCAGMVRNIKIGELVYAMSVPALHNDCGFPQISIRAEEVARASNTCDWGNDGTAMQTSFIVDVLKEEIKPFFCWQFKPDGTCPNNCHRDATTARCVPN